VIAWCQQQVPPLAITCCAVPPGPRAREVLEHLHQFGAVLAVGAEFVTSVIVEMVGDDVEVGACAIGLVVRTELDASPQ